MVWYGKTIMVGLTEGEKCLMIGFIWLRGTVVERRSLTSELSVCPTLDLRLTGDHLCG